MQIVILLLLTILVSSISTVIGFGTGTIMVPVLLTFLPIGQTYLLVGVLQLFSSIWKIGLFWPQVRWHLVFEFGIPAIVGTMIGATTLFYIPSLLLYRLIGLLLIGYVLFELSLPNVELPRFHVVSVGLGFVVGFIGGLFGIRGPIRSAFLTAFDLPKREYICTSGVIGLGIDVVRLTIYLYHGMRLPQDLLASLLLLIPFSLIAAIFSQDIVYALPQRRFKYLVFGMLFIVGIKFLLNL